MPRPTRMDTILGLLESEGRINVTTLAEQLDVSEITVRRDLIALESSGHLRRVHGGAVSLHGRAFDKPFSVRESHQAQAKTAIARRACHFVNHGDAIALDVGSTVLAMVDELKNATNLTLVTANLRTAWAVAHSQIIPRPRRLIVSGGVVRDEELSMAGESAVSHYRKMRVDIAFIGVGGVNANAGFTDYNLEDAELKRVLIDSARKVIVLADSTKIGDENFVQVANLNNVDLLITDDQADPIELARLRAGGLSIEEVDVSADARR